MLEPMRTSFRRYVRLDCQVVREHDFRVVGDLAIDLSTKGMQVRSTARILTGEEVIISFKPPRSNSFFDAQGIVARVVHGRRPGDYGLSFGIEFINLSKDDESHLFEHIRGLNAPDAQRPPRPLLAPPRPTPGKKKPASKISLAPNTLAGFPPPPFNPPPVNTWAEMINA